MKRGFFMLEFLVYFVLFTVVVYLVMQMLAGRALALNHEQERHAQHMQYHGALDAMAHYFLRAPLEKKEYYTADASMVVWHDSEAKKDKGFMLKDRNLYWCQGIFNQVTISWQSVRKVLLAHDVENFDCSLRWRLYKKREWLNYCMCSFTGHGKQYKRTMNSDKRLIV